MHCLLVDTDKPKSKHYPESDTMGTYREMLHYCLQAIIRLR